MYRYVAQLSLYKRDIFVSVFCELFSQSYKEHYPPPLKFAIVTTLSKFVICPLLMVHFMQKCFHNRNAVSLKSKTNFVKIPETCNFGLKCCPLCWESKTENRFRIHALVCLLQHFKIVLLKIFHYPMQNPLRNVHSSDIFYVKPKPMCVSGIGFQFHTSGTKENILSEKILLNKKSLL